MTIDIAIQAVCGRKIFIWWPCEGTLNDFLLWQKKIANCLKCIKTQNITSYFERCLKCHFYLNFCVYKKNKYFPLFVKFGNTKTIMTSLKYAPTKSKIVKLLPSVTVAVALLDTSLNINQQVWRRHVHQPDSKH